MNTTSTRYRNRVTGGVAELITDFGSYYVLLDLKNETKFILTREQLFREYKRLDRD